MEEALRSGFTSGGFQVLFEKLAKFAAKEIKLILGADDGLRKLQRILLRIQAILDYVEDCRVRFPNNKCKTPWKMWLEDLNRLCYDAEDMLDELSFQLPNFNGIDQVSPEKRWSDEDCWQIMKQRALSKLNIRAHEKLEQIGRNTAKKCKGLPLAAKTLGSVLHSKCDKKEWYSILEREFWDLEQDKNDIIPSLALSYFHLPARLKKCFAYCSIFPQNHEFEVDDLILIWIAEGFVEPNGERRVEDIGKDYLKDLLWSSLFQCSYGNLNFPRICKMHNLIHSMAQLVSSNVCYRMETESMHWYPFYRSIRHLSLSHDKLQFFLHPEFLAYPSLLDQLASNCQKSKDTE